MPSRQVHKIDATDRILGRLATQIATLLRGKHKPSFMPHKDEGDFVTVKNIGKLKFTGNKMETKVYRWHSGYPGGLKEQKLKDLWQKDPAKVVWKAVYGMLPKNKLRKVFIKRLKIEL